MKLPSATDGLAVAFGAEYRSEESETRNDVEFQTNDLLGQGGAQLNIQGSYDVREVFVEARLPLVQDKIAGSGALVRDRLPIFRLQPGLYD